MILLPDKLKLRNGWSKYFSRTASANIMPKEIVWRRKKTGMVLEKDRVGEDYNFGGNCEQTNLTVTDMLCIELDGIFRNESGFVERFSDALAARGKPTVSLKNIVKDRQVHDRHYAVSTT